MDNKSIRESKLEFWSAFWPSLQQATRDTERYIDKKVYGIATGGIGIEITLLQLLTNIRYMYFVVISLIMFTLTLLLNLYSHVKSMKSQEKEGNKIQQFFNDENRIDDSYIYDTIQEENEKITNINIISIISMLLAIIALFHFILLNI